MRPYFAYIIIAALIAVCLVVLGAQGVRGTDQYWYVGDTQQMADGKAPISNNYFPGKLLREAQNPTPNYIMHNNPLMHLVAFSSGVLSVYNTWIVLNSLFHLIIAFCIYVACIHYVGRREASLATVLYLLSPIALWQVVNPLLEQYFALIMAVSMVLFIHRKNTLCFISLLLVLGVGMNSHPIFVLPAYFFLLLSVYENYRNAKYGLCIVAVGYGILLLLTKPYVAQLMPTSFQPSLSAIITSAVPGKSNMFWHYSDIQPELSLSLMMSKLWAAVNTHLFNLRFAPHYIFTNIALFSLIYLLFFKWREYWRLLIPAFLIVGLYLGLIALQQNHPRYQQIIAPVSFLIIGIVIAPYLVKLKWPLLGLPLCLVLAVNVVTMVKASKQSRYESAQMIHVAEEIGRYVPETARLASLNHSPHNPMSYLLRPREVLFIKSKLLQPDRVAKAIELFKPEYMLVRKELPDSTMELVGKVPDTMFGDILIYKLGDGT